MDSLIQDLKFATRTLLRRPGFVAVATITMALGIGANTAIFSVVNGVLLKPLPYPNPERLVVLAETSKEVPETAVSYPDYLDWRARPTVFQDLAERMPAGFVFTGDGEPERVIGRWVSASFFQTLGVQPQIGRAFTEQEESPSAERVVVLGHGLWQRRFGGDESVIGRSIRMNAESWTVIGVMPADFDFYGRQNLNNEFLVPLGRLTDRDYMRDRNSHVAWVIGRLNPGVTLYQARSEITSIAAALEKQYPASNTGTGVSLRPFSDDYLGDAPQALLVISAAVILVLLIACANVANLLLARAAGRQKEIALRLALLLVGIFATIALLLAAVGVYGLMSYTVTARMKEIGIRMALGAQSRDALRLVLLRGLALSLSGIAIGVAGAFGLTRLMSSLLFGVSATDPLTFVVISVLLTGVALGACFVPARRAAKVDPMIALRCE